MAEKKVAKKENTVVKAAKKTEVVAPKPAEKTKKTSPFSVTLFALTGKEAGELDLPKELFGAKVNKTLLAQALRVYLSNQKSHWGHTKTRGEVQGSTRKIYKQKGTGRARHGSKMAPIFVKGGIAMGPRKRDVELGLPKKMKKAALVSALSQKLSEKQVFGVTGLDKASGKTKEAAQFIKNFGQKSALVITGQKIEPAHRAFNNIQGVKVQTADQLNVLSIISYKSLVLTKESILKLMERINK